MPDAKGRPKAVRGEHQVCGGKLLGLRAGKARLEAVIEVTSTAVGLHLRVAEIYKVRIGEFAKALSADEEASLEAPAVLRDLIKRKGSSRDRRQAHADPGPRARREPGSAIYWISGCGGRIPLRQGFGGRV